MQPFAPRPVEMLQLAHSYAVADTAGREGLLAVGDGMLATWKGTAFDVYYFFNLVTLLVLALLAVRAGPYGSIAAVPTLDLHGTGPWARVTVSGYGVTHVNRNPAATSSYRSRRIANNGRLNLPAG